MALWGQFHKVSWHLRSQTRPLFEALGLSGAGCHILRMLGDSAGEGLTLTQISERLLRSNGNTTGIVDKLEEAGLVARHPHPTDRRALLLRLTPAGEDVYRDLQPAFSARVTALLSCLSAAEQEQLRGMLDRLLQATPNED